MGKDSPYKVPMSALDAVHVDPAEMVEELDVTPPVPDIKGMSERDRELMLRIGAGGA